MFIIIIVYETEDSSISDAQEEDKEVQVIIEGIDNTIVNYYNNWIIVGVSKSTLFLECFNQTDGKYTAMSACSIIITQKSFEAFVLQERSCFWFKIIHIKYIHYLTGRNTV